MDIAAFKVSLSVGTDIDATALRAARARSSSIQGGDGTLHMWGSIRGKAHHLPRNTQSNGQHFSGAMDEMSQKVQKASTHIPMPRSRTRLS
jgi:hypothetical protein